MQAELFAKICRKLISQSMEYIIWKNDYENKEICWKFYLRGVRYKLL